MVSNTIMKHPTQEARLIHDSLDELLKNLKTDKCGETADEVMKKRLFDRPETEVINSLLYTKVDNKKNISQLLKQQEPRMYNFSFGGLYFVGDGKEQEQPFPGHSFVVLQYTPNAEGKVFFRVIQSYLKKYRGYTFFQKESKYLESKELFDRYIDPYFRLALHCGDWTDKHVQDYKSISGVDISHLTGYHPLDTGGFSVLSSGITYTKGKNARCHASLAEFLARVPV